MYGLLPSSAIPSPVATADSDVEVLIVPSKWAVVLQNQLHEDEGGMVSHSPSDLPVSDSSRLFPCPFRDMYCDDSYVFGETRPDLVVDVYLYV